MSDNKNSQKDLKRPLTLFLENLEMINSDSRENVRKDLVLLTMKNPERPEEDYAMIQAGRKGKDEIDTYIGLLFKDHPDLMTPHNEALITKLRQQLEVKLTSPRLKK
ncbi:MAG: hypothetical protein H0W64_01815 [Gammaproteobacteria bacterium]|nr:hypothetical protein [Gammaproteobacteria bacterium]